MNVPIINGMVLQAPWSSQALHPGADQVLREALPHARHPLLEAILAFPRGIALTLVSPAHRQASLRSPGEPPDPAARDQGPGAHRSPQRLADCSRWWGWATLPGPRTEGLRAWRTLPTVGLSTWPAMGSVDRTWALPGAALMLSCSWPHPPSRGHPPLITAIKPITDAASCLLQGIDSGKLRRLPSEVHELLLYEPLTPSDPNPSSLIPKLVHMASSRPPSPSPSSEGRDLDPRANRPSPVGTARAACHYRIQPKP